VYAGKRIQTKPALAMPETILRTAMWVFGALFLPLYCSGTEHCHHYYINEKRWNEM
jgi:hypothetical protein